MNRQEPYNNDGTDNPPNIQPLQLAKRITAPDAAETTQGLIFHDLGSFQSVEKGKDLPGSTKPTKD